MSNNNYRILSEEIPCLEIKNMPNVKISGIYKIENIINHKIYIGQSNNIISRFKRGHLRMTDECNTLLEKAFRKYGYENFTVTVIKETYDLDYWEIFLIQIYHATDRERGYNICSGGEGGNTFQGKHHTEETKKKKSEAMKKFYSTKVWTDEERDRCRYWKGKKHTEEYKLKMSEASKGKHTGPKSEETKRKISESLKGNIPWNKGKKMNEEYCKKQREAKLALYSSEKGAETREKLRRANLGKHPSEETIRKTAETLKGRVFSEEHRRKLSEKAKNRVISEETRKKISEALKCRPNPNKGKHWFNDGVKSVRCFECPEGFVPGFIY